MSLNETLEGCKRSDGELREIHHENVDLSNPLQQVELFHSVLHVSRVQVHPNMKIMDDKLVFVGDEPTL